MIDGLGWIIGGIILAVIGYLIRRLVAEAIIRTVGYIVYIIGIILIIIGFIFLVLGIVGPL